MAYVMTAEEYRKALEHYGLTQAKAAMLFNGKSDRTGRRWAAEGAPFHVALILSMMHRRGLTVDYIDGLGSKWRKRLKKGGNHESTAG